MAAEKKARKDAAAAKKALAQKKTGLVIPSTPKQRVQFKETAQQRRDRLRVVDPNFTAEIDLTGPESTTDTVSNSATYSPASDIDDLIDVFDDSLVLSPCLFSSRPPLKHQPLIMSLRPRK